MGNWKYLIVKLKVPQERQLEVSNWVKENGGLFTMQKGFYALSPNWVYGKAKGNVGKCSGDNHVYRDLCEIIEKFPYITGHVHVGEDYEGHRCVGTMIVVDGEVEWKKPMKRNVKEAPLSSSEES